MISFFVHGKAVPKGSARAMRGPSLGAPCPRCNQSKRGQPFVINANDRTKAWEKTLRGAARVAMVKHEKIETAVDVDMVFIVERPKSHYVSNNRDRPLKEKHRETIFHISKPDVDKLARAVLDGLTNICFGDDSTVCRISSVKYYGEKPGVQLTIKEAVVPDEVRRRYEEDFQRKMERDKLVQKTSASANQPELF